MPTNPPCYYVLPSLCAGAGVGGAPGDPLSHTTSRAVQRNATLIGRSALDPPPKSGEWDAGHRRNPTQTGSGRTTTETPALPQHNGWFCPASHIAHSGPNAVDHRRLVVGRPTTWRLKGPSKDLRHVATYALGYLYITRWVVRLGLRTCLASGRGLVFTIQSCPPGLPYAM